MEKRKMSDSFEIMGIRLFRPNGQKSEKWRKEHQQFKEELAQDIKEFYNISEDTLNKRFTE